MEKSPSALKTIGEVADLLGVQSHVLRFWETQFTQIHPQKQRGGRRYYRPEDVEMLQYIQRLLHQEGFTIEGAKKKLLETGNFLTPAETTKPLHSPLEALHKELLNIRNILHQCLS